MRLTTERSESSGFSREFAPRRHCPHCGDRLIAPEVSEFIEGGMIQHYWVCDGCGEQSHTLLKPAPH
jgi:uncharacterized protein with PIN domain